MRSSMHGVCEQVQRLPSPTPNASAMLSSAWIVFPFLHAQSPTALMVLSWPLSLRMNRPVPTSHRNTCM